MNDKEKTILCERFQMTDRILTGIESIILTRTNLKSFAFTEASEGKIYLNPDRIRKILKLRLSKKDDLYKFIAICKGLNYHEVSHILYTDISKKSLEIFLSKKAKSEGYNSLKDFIKGSFDFEYFLKLINIIEDGRIENLFVKEYPNSKKYFYLCVLNLIYDGFEKGIIKEDSFLRKRIAYLEFYFSLYSRKYLPKEWIEERKKIRKILKKDYGFSEDFLKKCEKIVNDYLVSIDKKERVDLIYELYTYLEELIYFCEFKGSSDNNSITTVSKNQEEMKKVKKIIEEISKDIEEEIKAETEETEGTKEIEETEGTDEEIENEEKNFDDDFKDNEEELNQDEEESDEEISDDEERLDNNKENNLEDDEKEKEDNNDLEEEKDTEKNKKEREEDIQDSLKNLKEKTTEDTINNSFVKDEIEKDIDASKKKVDEDLGGERFQVTRRINREILKLEKILKRLKGDLTASIKRNQRRGLIDINSALKAKKRGSMNIFKNKKMNTLSQGRIAVVLIVDSSSSIDECDWKKEIESAYILSQALERSGNKVKIYEFSNFNREMKSFYGNGDWIRELKGNTYGSPVVRKAIKDLEDIKSREKIDNLFIFLMSDGYFDDFRGLSNYLNIARKKGIKSFWVLASYMNGEDDEAIRKSSFDWFIKVDKIEDLGEAMKDKVINIQKVINQNIKRRFA